MSKMSEASKRRIKDENIYAHSKHLLNIIWACRDNATYNGTQWYVKDQFKLLIVPIPLCQVCGSVSSLFHLYNSTLSTL